MMSQIIRDNEMLLDLYAMTDRLNKRVKGNVEAKEKAKEDYNGTLENNKIVKEVPFKSEMERINLMKQLGGKYGTIRVDEEKHVVVCYTKCYKNK